MYTQNEIEDYIYEIAICASNHGLTADAGQLIGYGISEFPDSKLLTLASASIELASGDIDKALEIIDQNTTEGKVDIFQNLKIFCYLHKKEYQMATDLSDKLLKSADSEPSKELASKAKELVAQFI